MQESWEVTLQKCGVVQAGWWYLDINRNKTIAAQDYQTYSEWTTKVLHELEI